MDKAPRVVKRPDPARAAGVSASPAVPARPRRFTPRAVGITVAAVAASAVGVPWLLRSAGVLGPATPDVKVVARVPTPAGGAGGGFVFPDARPADRPAVVIAAGDVPEWFRTAVASGSFDGTRPPGQARRSPPVHRLPPPATRSTAGAVRPAVAPPADPLVDVRSALAGAPELVAWLARYQADVAAERPTGAGRLDELRGLLAARPLPAATIDRVDAALATLGGDDGRAAAAWRASARPGTGAAAAERSTAPAVAPATARRGVAERFMELLGGPTTRPTTRRAGPG